MLPQRCTTSLFALCKTALTIPSFLDYLQGIPTHECRTSVTDLSDLVQAISDKELTRTLLSSNLSVAFFPDEDRCAKEVVFDALLLSRRHRLRSASLLTTAARRVVPPTARLLSTLATLGYKDEAFWGTTVRQHLMPEGDDAARNMSPGDLLMVLEAYLSLGYSSEALFLYVEQCCLRRLGEEMFEGKVDAKQCHAMVTALRQYVRENT